ncbi:hypothetical protein P256_01628 [Acinetobacter nectaris CIP 110549]|uniref:SCP2 domain-containing protein n=2 Tax=Acinetobacter nectaris TaxID=1219382 RepID=V2UU18_9GAMM|nr:hypothetical protein P256_01628 [Acinetobacter nectaris CIP 110549]
MRMNFSAIPVVKLPVVDVSTDPLDLLVAGIALRMKQLAKTSPKFIELTHDRQVRVQISTQKGMARQIIIDKGAVSSVSGQAEPADLVLQFRNSDQGVKTFLKNDASAILSGIQKGTIELEGDQRVLVVFAKLLRLLPPKLPTSVQQKVQHARAFIRKKTGR